MEFIELFEFAFMRRALIAGLLIALMTSILGVFVVQRGLAFLGDGLAHASFGGMGLGALIIFGLGASLGTDIFRQPLWVALPFTIMAALGIAWVRDQTNLASDTAVGVFFAVSVSLGVIFFSIIPPDADIGVDVFDLLFGSILGIRQVDLLLIVIVCVLSLLFFALAWGHLGYATFDEEMAKVDGIRSRILEYLLFAIAGVVVAVSAFVVGIILIAAYLVIPAAAARLLSRSLIEWTIISLGIGVITTFLGLIMSFILDVPSGSTIVLSQALTFILAIFFGKLRA
jgi:zinc transport system permease protein|tara:strand:- start:198 stop:1052 length:855 start_codon:yes stop_codon:yes gene_type:complete